MYIYIKIISVYLYTYEKYLWVCRAAKPWTLSRQPRHFLNWKGAPCPQARVQMLVNRRILRFYLDSVIGWRLTATVPQPCWGNTGVQSLQCPSLAEAIQLSGPQLRAYDPFSKLLIREFYRAKRDSRATKAHISWEAQGCTGFPGWMA